MAKTPDPTLDGPRMTPDRDLPPIHPPSDEDFLSLCVKFKVPPALRDRFCKKLGQTAHFVERIRLDQKRQKKPSEQVKKFRKLASRMREAALLIDEYDTVYPHVTDTDWEIVEPFALRALCEETASGLRDIVSGKATDLYPLTKRPRPPDMMEIEEAIGANPGIVIFNLLTTLGLIFRKVADRVEKETKPGPRRLQVGPTLLLHMAEYYFFIGRKPVKSRIGLFRDFIEDVLRGMGVDTKFVDGHIAGAVDAWRKTKDSHQEMLG